MQDWKFVGLQSFCRHKISKRIGLADHFTCCESSAQIGLYTSFQIASFYEKDIYWFALRSNKVVWIHTHSRLLQLNLRLYYFTSTMIKPPNIVGITAMGLAWRKFWTSVLFTPNLGKNGCTLFLETCWKMRVIMLKIEVRVIYYVRTSRRKRNKMLLIVFWRAHIIMRLACVRDAFTDDIDPNELLGIALLICIKSAGAKLNVLRSQSAKYSQRGIKHWRNETGKTTGLAGKRFRLNCQKQWFKAR